MKIKSFIYLSLYLISNVNHSQVICDDNACINIDKSLLFPNKVQESPEVLMSKSKERKIQLQREGVVFDLNCEYPSFWIFTTRDDRRIKKLDKAKSLGVAVRIYRESSCDINKYNLIVPIFYNNKENYAVTSYDGDPVFVDDCFGGLITKEKYWCKGLPFEPTQYHNCKICGKSYSLQRFKAKIGGVEMRIDTFYCSIKGQCYYGHNHDNIELDDSIPICSNRGNTY